jgi:hypothetical protein
MKKLVIGALVWTFLVVLMWSPAIAQQQSKEITVEDLYSGVEGCTEESKKYFYGFSVGPNYIYRDGDSSWPRTLRLEKSVPYVLQLDIFAHDDYPLFNVRSHLIPISSAQRGDFYGMTELTMRFQALFWRHTFLEGRDSGWHIWALDVGVEEIAGEPVEYGYTPFCKFTFFVNMYYPNE